MRRSQAEHIARKSMQSGYSHHSYEQERLTVRHFLEQQELDLSLEEYALYILHAYDSKLGPTRLRSMKNTVLAVISNLCRQVADYGADMELSFSLSDYYFNAVEATRSEEELQTLLVEILLQYKKLADNSGSPAQAQGYSLPVVRSIRYIRQHLYDRCRPAEVAAAVKLHPNYLSTLFHRETGQTLSRYIRQTKLEEARYLLLYDTHSVLEIAELLGYESLSYFSSDFKKYYGMSPRQYAAEMIRERA